MFYLAFKLQNQKEYCTPKGPRFKRSNTIRFSVNNNKIVLKAPPHSASGPFTPVEPHNPKSNYDLNDLYLPSINTDDNDWGGVSTLFRVWDFYGPWFTGKRGQLRLRIYIISPRAIKEDTSFFHPRSFENVIADYLSHHNSDILFDDEQAWYAPTDWSPLNNFPCVAVTFQAKPNRKINRGNDPRYFLAFPISDHHLIIISLDIRRSRVYIHSDSKPEPDTDKWINRAPMEELAKDIIDSVTLTLSPETLELQNKALEGLDDISLSKSFLPLKWAGNTRKTKLL